MLVLDTSILCVLSLRSCTCLSDRIASTSYKADTPALEAYGGHFSMTLKVTLTPVLMMLTRLCSINQQGNWSNVHSRHSYPLSLPNSRSFAFFYDLVKYEQWPSKQMNQRTTKELVSSIAFPENWLGTQRTFLVSIGKRGWYFPQVCKSPSKDSILCYNRNSFSAWFWDVCRFLRWEWSFYCIKVHSE